MGWSHLFASKMLCAKAHSTNQEPHLEALQPEETTMKEDTKLSWREQTVIRILLTCARIIGKNYISDEEHRELKRLANSCKFWS